MISVRQVLQEIPGYLGGYVELAVYECARNQPDAAVDRVRSRASALAGDAREVREPRRRNSAALHRAAAANHRTVGRRIRTHRGWVTCDAVVASDRYSTGLRERRADGSAEEHRQRWNGAAGHAWVAAARCSIGCSSRSPIDSPIWQPRVVPIGCSTVAAGREARRVAIARRMGTTRHASASTSRNRCYPRRGRADTEGVTATFICANAQTYPFEPESFDLIVSRFGVMVSSQDSVEAPANLRRAARAGGELR